MFSIVDRYISKTFVFFFVAGLLTFATVILSIEFMSSFARFNVETGVLLRYYSYFAPEILHQLIPVACLLGTVTTLTTLNKNNELTAMFSLGMSLARICVPILVMVSLVSVLSFFVGDQVLPKLAQKKNYVYFVEIRNKPGLYSTVKTDKIWYRTDNVLFNIKSLNAEESKAQGITLYYFDEAWNLIQLIKAKTVNMVENQWKLKDGLVTLFASESSYPLTKNFNEKTIQMNEEIGDLKSGVHSGDSMTVNQLGRFIKKNKEAGLDTLAFEVDYYGKFAYAFAAFVMTLLGIPFSVRKQRSGGALVGIGMCVGVAVLYWVLFSSFMSLGKSGTLPPFLAAWGPNFILVVSSLALVLRLKR